jgi:integrase/recombinase XerD
LRREETKTHQPIEVPFPDELVPALERYLGYYRALLAGDRYRGDHLWVSYFCGPQSPHTLQLRLVLHTEKAFGRPVNPHLFRDCVATAIAIHDPENVRMAATVLGHRSFAVTERHYNLARTLEAGRSYAAVIGKARGSCRRARRIA